MEQKKLVRYTDSFKEKVIHELETGRFLSMEEAQFHYNIGGSQTIRRWLVKAGKTNILPVVVLRDTNVV